MPAIAYAGRPFFASAAAALRQMRTNMDVPISLGVILVTGMSLAQTMQGGAHTYFDSAITLLFFLLIGRVLDHRARGQARATAEQLLTLRATDVAVLQSDGSIAAPQPACRRARRSRAGRPGRADRRRWRRRTRRVHAGCQSRHRRKPAGRSRARHAGVRRHAQPRRAADGARDRHRQRHAARRMRAADRGGGGTTFALRRARRPGGATLRAGGASHRAADIPVVVSSSAGASVRRGAADRERGADHHLPLRAGACGAGGAGDRHRRGCSAPACC